VQIDLMLGPMGRKGQTLWEGRVRPRGKEGTELMGRKGQALWDGRDRPRG
jgi:hypothetical protein